MELETELELELELELGWRMRIEVENAKFYTRMRSGNAVARSGGASSETGARSAAFCEPGMRGN